MLNIWFRPDEEKNNKSLHLRQDKYNSKDQQVSHYSGILYRVVFL